MNIFNLYSEIIKNLVIKNQKILSLKYLNDFKGVTVENPPEEFDYELSCNIGLILAKINKQNPKILSTKIKEIILKEVKDISEIQIAGPGFLNLKFKNEALIKIILDILDKNEAYGSMRNNKKYNIEFVSANPTGPMHVGHCRGAIYGDVLSYLLIFNGNKVSKEYYINDYGNQIKNFVKSVFLRIREIKYNETFQDKKDLYPGDYIVEIAHKIINEDKNEQFKDYDNGFESLKIKSLKYSMDLIKKDLKNLGIVHNNFFSETNLINKKW